MGLLKSLKFHPQLCDNTYLLHNGVPNLAPRRLIIWAESCIGFGGGAVGELLSCSTVAVFVFMAGFAVDAVRRIVRGSVVGLFQKSERVSKG